MARKYWLILLILLPCLLLCNCKSGSTGARIQVGMDYTEFEREAYDLDCFYYMSYAFYVDHNGDPTIVLFEQNKIVDITSYDCDTIDTSDDTFVEITKGMDIYDVVSRVGVPVDSATFGMPSLLFKGSSRNYVIYLDDLIRLTVSSVTPQEP